MLATAAHILSKEALGVAACGLLQLREQKKSHSCCISCCIVPVKVVPAALCESATANLGLCPFKYKQDVKCFSLIG